MPKDKSPIPFTIRGSNYDMNLRFYRRYDECFLYSKMLALLYIVDNAAVVEQIEAFHATYGGSKLSEKYMASIRAEMLFTALQQCEAFFALLIAVFQPLPHWLYLTTYKPGEVQTAVDQILENNVAELTGNNFTNLEDVVMFSVYMGSVSLAPEHASRWDENVANVVWLISNIAEFYLKYAQAYNSYKHGLRVMVAPFALSLAPQNPDGSLQGPMRTIFATQNTLTYLEKEPVRVVEGEKEIPISETTIEFNPIEASAYMHKMNQLLTTMKATRLAVLANDGVSPSINTFFGLDRSELQQLATVGKWTQTPLRSDQARWYGALVAQMKARAEKSTEETEATAPTPVPSETIADAEKIAEED